MKPLLLTMVLGLACVHTNAAVVDITQKFAPLCPDGVKVFSDTSKVGKPYQEVALLNSKGESGSTSERGMINSQRKKAAEDDPVRSNLGRLLAIYIPGDSTRVKAACNGTENRN